MNVMFCLLESFSTCGSLVLL